MAVSEYLLPSQYSKDRLNLASKGRSLKKKVFALYNYWSVRKNHFYFGFWESENHANECLQKHEQSKKSNINNQKVLVVCFDGYAVLSSDLSGTAL